jgi:predicted RNA-binding protein
MVYIVYDRAIDEEVIDTLEGLDIFSYTKWRDVVGVGAHDPHLGDHVWPGLNNVIMVITDNEKKEKLMSTIKVLQKSFSSVGLRVFIVPVLDMG